MSSGKFLLSPLQKLLLSAFQTIKDYSTNILPILYGYETWSLIWENINLKHLQSAMREMNCGLDKLMVIPVLLFVIHILKLK
jgi:hypothetical protein